MNKKYFIGFVLLIFLLAPFWGRLKKIMEPGQTRSRLTKVRVGIVHWVGNSIFFYADQQKIFEKNGIEVELVEFQDSAVGKQLLNTNKVDVLPFTPDVVIALKAAGADITVTGITDNSEGADGIMAIESIKNIKDLQGQTIAFENASPSQLLLALALKKEGLELKDIQPLNMLAGDAGAAFLAGKVNAAISWEPWLTKAASRPGGHVLTSTKEIPTLPTFLIFRTEFINNNRETAMALQKSYFQAVAMAKLNPEQVESLIAEKYNLSREESVFMMQKFSWLDLGQNNALFAGDESHYKSITNTANQIWAGEKFIASPANLEEVWDDSILKELTNELSQGQ